MEKICPPQDEQLRIELVKQAFNEILATSKPKWNQLPNDTQIYYCTMINEVLKSAGFTQEEASGFSLFVGPFMDSAPPQATVKDAVMAYRTNVSNERRQQNLADVKNILDFTLTGAQIIDTMKRQK